MKKLLIVLSLLFSILFFDLDKINAYTYNGVEINQSFFNKGWSLLEGTNNGGSTYFQSDFPLVYIQYGYSSNEIFAYFITDFTFQNYSTSTRAVGFSSSKFYDYKFIPGFAYNTSTKEYRIISTNVQVIPFYTKTAKSNFDVYDNNNSLLYAKAFDYTPPIKTSFNVNFHINDSLITNVGIGETNIFAYDKDFTLLSDSQEFKQIFKENTKYIKENYDFNGWYYDEEFTRPFNINDNITNDIDLYAKYIPNIYNINFHLNGGWVYNEDVNFGSEKDFTISLYRNEFSEFMSGLIPSKIRQVFDGWYYDSSFLIPLYQADILESNIDLYAKWTYSNVNDFLDNTTFNNYIFDKNYYYAIISRGSNEGDIYLGLETLRHDIEVIKYLKNDNKYTEESAFCLTNIYTKNNINYYKLANISNDYEVLILKREIFDEIENYNFLMTPNAHIEYTNSLENVIIYDDNDNQINTNAQFIYDKLQESKLKENSDIIFIFKDIFDLENNEILNKFNTMWNKLKTCVIFKYIYLLITGAFIIYIIRVARR